MADLVAEPTNQDILLRLAATLLRKKWRVAIKTLVQNDADTLLIAPSVVLLSLDHFGSHVLACANDRVCRCSITAAVPPIDQIF